MNKNGAVFVITLIILSIAVMVCAGLATMMSRDVYTARRMKASTQAYFLAEAGIEESIQDLHDNNFSFAGFPKNETLGSGSFTVPTPQPYSDNIYKIECTGTVSDVSRKISVIVRDTRPEAFRYAMLSGGRMRIGHLGIGYNAVVNGDIHSNNGSMSFWNPALLIGFLAEINGQASADGRIVDWGGDEVTTWPTSDISTNIYGDKWNDFKQLSQVYPGSQTWTNANLSGIIWVNGNATLIGNCTLNGSLFATAHITIVGSITQSLMAGYEYLPAFATQGGSINIFTGSRIEGLIYSNNGVTITFADIDGAIICGGEVSIGLVTLNYVAPIPFGSAPLEVICWGS